MVYNAIINDHSLFIMFIISKNIKSRIVTIERCALHLSYVCNFKANYVLKQKKIHIQ